MGVVFGYKWGRPSLTRRQRNKKHALPIRLYSVQEGQVLFSLFSLSPPADRRQLTASSVELAQLGREAKQSLSGGRSRLVRAAQELPVELHVADAQERRVGQRVREAVRHEHVDKQLACGGKVPGCGYFQPLARPWSKVESGGAGSLVRVGVRG